jgi:hypothetical protein
MVSSARKSSTLKRSIGELPRALLGPNDTNIHASSPTRHHFFSH